MPSHAVPSDVPARSLPLWADLYLVVYATNTDKFHRSMLIDRYILIRYGRGGTRGADGVKAFDTPQKAAAAYWGLLREKTAKGYHVRATGVGGVDDALVSEFLDSGPGYARRAMASALLNTVALTSLTATRGPLTVGLDVTERSPRTPTQGRDVLLALARPEPPIDVLLAAAAVADSERFLRHLVLSHPACPEEAEVVAALSGSTWDLI
jgi:predicted DNA-binding WGR domain protein